MIHFRGAFFQNVSAWSLHVKRLTAPERKADDGWHCVRHDGKLLHDLKADAAAALGLRTGGESDADATAGADAAAAPAAAPAAAHADAAVPVLPPGFVAAPKQLKPPKPQPPPASPPRAGSPDAAPLSTDYARSRPQRERREPQRLAPNISDTAAAVLDADDLVLVDCVPYDEVATSPDAPPPPVSSLRVSASATLLMDFHCHLSSAEVIGFLGGTWCPVTRQLRVLRALPAAQLVSGDAAVEVEVDPSCMPSILEALEAEGLSAVGW
jgi:hypothetical protein